MQKVEGSDYLYQHGGRFLIRMQVPSALRSAVGKRELKKTLGSDLVAARRNSHRVIADFDRLISRARFTSEPAHAVAAGGPDRGQIDLAVHTHFRRMALQMRGKSVADETDPDPRSRVGRIPGYERHIGAMLDALDSGGFISMAAQADWLCEEQGWTLDHSLPLFDYLCERMLRARLACYQAEVAHLKIGFAPPGDDPLLGPTPPKPAGQPRQLGDLIDKFNKERADSWSVSTRKNYVIITRVIEEMCGRDTPLSAIDKDFCRDVRDLLKRLPSNYQKKPETRGRPIREVIEIAAARDMPLLQPATINSHLNKLGAFVRFGRDEGWIVGNPMADIDVHDPVDASEKRDPFNLEQLGMIFAAEPWALGHATENDRPSRFWVPLLALFTGARLSEIAGLRTDEIITRDGHHLIHVRNRADRPTKKRKSRIIPVHRTLAAIGFLAFVERQRKAGAVLLFPEQKANSLVHWGDDVSDWFGRLVKRLSLHGRKLTMHSFRHSFEDALREADLHDTPLGNTITGRSSGGVSRNYGKTFSTARLVHAIEQVAYPGLALDHLMIKKPDSDG